AGGFMIPRYTGIDADGTSETEADHFMRCPGVASGSTCATSRGDDAKDRDWFYFLHRVLLEALQRATTQA
ncbi:MAG: hypothetical protein ACXWJO_08155, partial [Xanthobacteraceae bacterium]